MSFNIKQTKNIKFLLVILIILLLVFIVYIFLKKNIMEGNTSLVTSGDGIRNVTGSTGVAGSTGSSGATSGVTSGVFGTAAGVTSGATGATSGVTSGATGATSETTKRNIASCVFNQSLSKLSKLSPSELQDTDNTITFGLLGNTGYTAKCSFKPPTMPTTPYPKPTTPSPTPTTPSPMPTTPSPMPTTPAPMPTTPSPMPTTPAPIPTTPSPIPKPPPIIPVNNSGVINQPQENNCVSNNITSESTFTGSTGPNNNVKIETGKLIGGELGFTICVWVNLQSTTNTLGRIIDFGNGLTDNILLLFIGYRIGRSSQLRMRYQVQQGDEGTWKFVETNQDESFLTNKWTFVSVVQSRDTLDSKNSSVKIFWDGRLVASTWMKSFPQKVTRSNLYVGNLKGKMKDLMVWNNALSSEQLTALQFAPLGIIPSDGWEAASISASELAERNAARAEIQKRDLPILKALPLPIISTFRTWCDRNTNPTPVASTNTLLSNSSANSQVITNSIP